MPTGARRLPEDERDAGGEAPRAAEPEVPLLALQRAAGNAAVTRLLAREPWVVNPLAPAAPAAPNVRDMLGVSEGMMADESAASRAAFTWFDAQTKGGVTVMSIAELVHGAGQQTFAPRAGGEAKVGDRIKPAALEDMLRGRARHFGVTVPEHREAGDFAGVRSELDAVLANIGAIPTKIVIGDDDAKITASISGTVKGEAKIGPAKVEGEVSSEGAEGSVKVPGSSLKAGVGDKGFKATLKLGELLSIDGGLNPKADGSVDWRAEISIGTIGKLVMPEDVAKVFKKAEETFAKSAGELARNRDDPAKVKEHGAALAGAVGEVLEKAKKSASQKGGWRLGAEFKGDGAGGVSGGITLTWVF